MIPALLTGKSLGETAYRCMIAALVAACVAWAAWTAGSSLFHAWRADVWKDRAIEARDTAKTATANAASANAGAANATTTRQAIDAGTVTLRLETEQSAQRIESYAERPAPVADLDPVDPDVLRELERAESRARAAADRLQRTRSR